MDAHQIYNYYQESLVEIHLMEGSESFIKYGSPIGGRLTYTFNDDEAYVDITIPHGIDISKGQLSASTGRRMYSKLALMVNAGCKRIYKISDENVTLLEKDGFFVFDIEPNGIRIL
ncbi:MAG: hypothetical protein COA31_005200 [Flavobacteriales bacterium]|nr:hypothetical protein [Flavobacteriales bacterium]